MVRVISLFNRWVVILNIGSHTQHIHWPFSSTIVFNAVGAAGVADVPHDAEGACPFQVQLLAHSLANRLHSHQHLVPWFVLVGLALRDSCSLTLLLPPLQRLPAVLSRHAQSLH